MTHVSCPRCRLRFTPVAAASLSACPSCEEALQADANAEQVLGFRLVTAEGAVDAVPTAVAMALPIPDPPL
jgi:hypothetical protein